jgi:HD-GYP domain-containing protein (c-di-GMP phosphodiesterase class II)
MIKVEKLGMETRKLNEEEYNQIKNHPLYGADILTKIKDIPEPIIYVAKEEHERMNGTGYPQGLKDGEISEYARIVAIVDVYEALTHDRPYRKKTSPHEAIKELIANNPLFDSRILKVLINKIGVYPISSWVELNSNEIGKVIINNNEFPLRPAVHILFDGTGQKLNNPHVINLAKQFNLFIKKSLTNDELAAKIKEPIEI